VVEFGEIKNMRFRQYGGRDIHRLADIRQIIEKAGIAEPFGVFVYVLFADFSICHQFCPNSHIRIIHETKKKVNLFHKETQNKGGENLSFSLFSRGIFVNGRAYDKLTDKKSVRKIVHGVFYKNGQKKRYSLKF